MVFMVSMVLVSLFGFYNARFSILDVFQNDPYPGRLCFKMILIRLCFKMILIRCFKMIRVPYVQYVYPTYSQVLVYPYIVRISHIFPSVSISVHSMYIPHIPKC